MNLTVATAALVVACLLGSAQTLAQNAYIANGDDNTVSVISTATNTVIGSPISVGIAPTGVAVTPDGSKVYVANNGFAGPTRDRLPDLRRCRPLRCGGHPGWQHS
jgi:YVTN family beta-propeller protein